MAKTYSADVHPPGKTGQWIKVETQADSESGAKDIFVAQYNLDPQQDIANIGEKRGGGSSSSGGDSEGNIALVGGICALAAAWWALPWVLSGVAIYGGYKISKGITGESVHSLGKKSNEKAALTMALIVAASGAGGFIGGKAIKGEFNSPTPVVIEEVKEVEEVKPSTYVDQTGNTVVDNQDNFRLLPDGSKVWY